MIDYAVTPDFVVVMVTVVRYLMVAVAVLILYYFLRRWALGQLTYRRYFAQSGVFVGDTADLVEEVGNNSFVPLFLIDIEAYLPGELALAGYERNTRPMQRFISRFNIAPFTKIKRTIKVECVKRGDYKLETVSVRFLYTKVYVESRTGIYVYPMALEQKESNPLQTDAQSLYLSERKLIQDPFSFAGIRGYQRGDPFRSINFKATAKKHVLMVNTHEFISVRNFMIYIDFHIKSGDAPPDHFEQLMEQAMSWSADLLQKAIRSGCAAGFAANCRLTTGERYVNYPMGSGYRHYTEILTEMAKIRLTAGNSLLSIITQDLNKLRNAEIFIYTHNPSQGFGGCLDVFRAMGNTVSIIGLG
jgi:uncharacterized protein (DUF58 family)